MNKLAPVFASIFPYTACKMHGLDKWNREVRPYELAHLKESDWPGFRTLGNLEHVVRGFEAWVDGSTYITRARSVATGHFLRSGHDVWLTVDDDVEADAHVLRQLIEGVRSTRHGIATAYVNRDGGSMTFRRVFGETRWLPCDVRAAVRSVDRVGFGLVVLHRDLVERLAADAPYFSEVDRPNGITDCPALFLEGVQEGSWVGEDYYFSALCERAGRPLDLLLDAPVSHAGRLAMLDLEGAIHVAGELDARELDAKLRAKEALYASEAD